MMTREIAHMQMFTAALDNLQPNFPPGVLQGDPRFTHTYFNMSNGEGARGPWNQGQGPWPAGQEWQYVEDPVDYVVQTKGLENHTPQSAMMSEAEAKAMDVQMSKLRSKEVKQAAPKGENQWSTYPAEVKSPKKAK